MTAYLHVTSAESWWGPICLKWGPTCLWGGHTHLCCGSTYLWWDTVSKEALPLYHKPSPVYEEVLPANDKSLCIQSRILPINDKTEPVHDAGLPVYNEGLPVYDESKLIHTVWQGEWWLEVYDDVPVISLLAAQTGSVAHAQWQHQRLCHIRYILIVLKQKAPEKVNVNHLYNKQTVMTSPFQQLSFPLLQPVHKHQSEAADVVITVMLLVLARLFGLQQNVCYVRITYVMITFSYSYLHDISHYWYPPSQSATAKWKVTLRLYT